jgi:ATP-dependent DNA helicase RecQ
LPESAPSLFHTARFSDPQQVLETIFGYREFRPGQRHIIDAVLAGRDCVGVMPTGAGKSLTFQLPAKLMNGAVLVISPLISLMKDQVDALQRLGFRATVLNSTVDFEERRRRLAALRRGEIELLYVAPEGLEGSLRNLIAGCRVSLVVVDEAHCISHWGHDFRPAYRRLSGLKQELGDIPVLALTATATKKVADDIIRELGMRTPDRFQGSFFRSNLIISARKKGPREGGQRGDTRREMLAVIRRHAGESGIVYCLSRRSVESTADWLRTQGVRAAAYHAGLSDEERERHQNDFRRREVDVIVATVAFGMGIDQSGVRFVIHRDMPRSIEAWCQEIGRAGRDGSESDCVVFYSWADVMGFDGFLHEIEDPVLREETRRRTVELFRLLDRRECRHAAMVRHFGERIEPCASSCDVCRGDETRELAPARGRAHRPRPGLAAIRRWTKRCS